VNQEIATTLEIQEILWMDHSVAHKDRQQLVSNYYCSSNDSRSLGVYHDVGTHRHDAVAGPRKVAVDHAQKFQKGAMTSSGL